MAKAWEVGGSFTPGTTARRSWPRLSFQAAGRRAGGAPRIPEGPAWQRTARAPGDPICSGTGSTTGGPGPDDDVAKPNSANRLALIIQRKQRQMSMVLDELGMEALEQQLHNATESPAYPPHRFVQKLVEAGSEGRAALIFEVCRETPSESSAALAVRARELVAAGADILVVGTDIEDTSTGLADLFAVCRAVPGTPVLRRDWFVHPLQIVEAKEAGACGVLGVIASVSGAGAPVLSSFSSAIGLDAPIEVVNLREVQQLEHAGVPLFSVNVSVGLSLSMPSIAADIAKGVLTGLPFGAMSVAGIRTLSEASVARKAGADALLVQRDLVNTFLAQQSSAGDSLFLKPSMSLASLVAELRYATSGDD